MVDKDLILRDYMNAPCIFTKEILDERCNPSYRILNRYDRLLNVDGINCVIDASVISSVGDLEDFIAFCNMIEDNGSTLICGYRNYLYITENIDYSDNRLRKSFNGVIYMNKAGKLYFSNLHKRRNKK